MPHTVPGPARAPGVAPLQPVSPVSPCLERSPQPQRALGATGLVNGPRNAPGADRALSWTFGKVRLPPQGTAALPVRIQNSGTAPASRADTQGMQRGQAPTVAESPASRVTPVVGPPDEAVASITLQRLIDLTVDARQAGSGNPVADADCAHALAQGWLTFRASLVAAASAEIPRWFSDVSERAPEAVRVELTRIAQRSLEDILSAACFKRHLQSPDLMAPLRAPIKRWLALHVAELQHADAAQGSVDAHAGANYLRKMDALLELPLPDAVKNGTLRCLISAIAIRSQDN